MLDSPYELIGKIRLGEDSSFSLMEDSGSGESVGEPCGEAIADELSALANAWGGVCLIGVRKETREIVGIPTERIDAVERSVREACARSVEPPLTPVIHRCWLPAAAGGEAVLLKVEIARGLFLHRRPYGHLHRLGNRTLPIPPDHVARLLDARANQHFDRWSLLVGSWQGI